MKRTYLPLFFCLLFACNSQSTNGSEEVGNYISAIYLSASTFKLSHNQLMDSCTKALMSMYSDYKIDTMAMRGILNTVLSDYKAGRQELLKVKELDSAINLRDKTMAFLDAANNFYTGEYKKLILLTTHPRNADSIAVLHSIGSQIKLIVKKDSIFLKAFDEFKQKYNLQFFGPDQKF